MPPMPATYAADIDDNNILIDTINDVINEERKE